MQTILLEQIRQKNPDKPLATILSEVLKISKDSAYRRIKNEIPLILPDVVKLCTTFDISFDQIIWLSQENKLNVKYFFSLQENSMEDLYISLLRVLNHIVDVASPETMLYNLTESIPFYYLARYPHIRKLNYYIWKYANMELDYDVPLISGDMPERIEHLFSLLDKKLQKINMTWVFNPSWLKNLFNDFIFFRKMSLISKEEFNFYKEEFSLLLDDMEREAGSNTEKKNTNILLSNVAFVGTTLLSVHKEKTADLLLFYNKNVLVSTNPSANKAQRDWARSICEKSLNISRGGILERKLFFKNMRDQLENSLSEEKRL